MPRRIVPFLAFWVLTLLAACTAHQAVITGEPVIYAADPARGEVLDRDTFPGDATQPRVGVVPHTGEIIAVVLNTVFVRHLEEAIGSPHVLVYSEVYDDATDDPAAASTRVLYNGLNQPAGVNLGLADRLLYGPAPFKGFPIRIRLFIVELDKEQKELASKIISAAGSIASMAQPQAGPAIAIGVAIAQAINALNEDDFELRVDLTLHPVGSEGPSLPADAALGALPQPEPVQRVGRPAALVSPLRTGPYLVFKRELPERFSSADRHLAELSVFDWSQEYFTSTYIGDGGSLVTADELLRLQGGYLYRVVRALRDANGKPLASATVYPRFGPNRHVAVGLAPGVRQRFEDQTYAALSIVLGLPVGLDPQSRAEDSRRAREQLGRLLDAPDDRSSAAAVGQSVQRIAAAAAVVLEQRRVAEEASRRVAREPALRSSPEYPLLWIGQIDSTPQTAGSFEAALAASRNRAILDSLAGVVWNLPILDPGNTNQMGALRALTPASLEPVADHPGAFRLKDGEAQVVALRAAH